ncbi:esterase family protein [Arthrobacter sp.]|uniref:alpha/beta hydrolase n=1 Tax=Arthrobacter sp. TaxID=1667 RepID=UPI0026E0B196|nr:alpha/beta hydrolase-fold protein [Arthrobacter sp.]MDO5751898.1 alpha/beta hydrolase-fold protein [Arthrobacter sp.]
MNWIHDLNLLNGPLPITFELLGAVSLAYLLVRRSPRWWLFAAVSAVASLLISYAACWAVIHVLFWWPEDLPAAVFLNVALILWALALGGTTALAGLRRRGPASGSRVEEGRSNRSRTSRRRRLLAVPTAAALLAVAGLQLNAAFGEFPTVGSLLAPPTVVSTAPPPAPQLLAAERFMKTSVSQRWNAPAQLPSKGTVLSVPIPGKESGFKARNAIVYLPPAYHAAARPVLPVLVLVSGQPGSPESWLRSTALVADLDAYAAAHGGLAPLVVIPDPNGSEQGNTMCMDTSLGRADTYMASDVPAWIKTNLDADTNPAHWAVGGFSFGGTCSVQMVTRHPDTFETFMAISPEREPALASKRSVTVERAFHGDVAAFDALVPLTLLAHKSYPQIHGWFASGTEDATYSANVKVLQEAARKAGMTTQSVEFPGGHSWSVASAALPQGFSFVFSRLGLP